MRLNLLGGQPGVVLELAERMANARPEEVEVRAEVGNGLARQIQKEGETPDFVGDVAGGDFHFEDVGVGDPKLQHVPVRL